MATNNKHLCLKVLCLVFTTKECVGGYKGGRGGRELERGRGRKREAAGEKEEGKGGHVFSSQPLQEVRHGLPTLFSVTSASRAEEVWLWLRDGE